VASWKATYRGLMPDEYLDNLSVHDRIGWWELRLTEPVRPRSALLVAEDDTGFVCGFGALWPNVESPAGVVELPQLYLVPSAWGHGIGYALMSKLAARAAELDYSEIVLWVHPDNARARRFYDSFGWVPSGEERTEEVWGVVVSEVQYRLAIRRSGPLGRRG
jgi:GNAT superfamily N-acetyltransferase